MMSLFGPLGKATKSCCFKGSGEETLCLEKFQLQPRQPPTISAPAQHHKSQLEQHSLSARLDGDSSDPASPPPQSPDLCQYQILQEAQGKPRLQWVCVQDPSLSVLPTSTAFSCCRMFQEPPPLSRHMETMSQQQH